MLVTTIDYEQATPSLSQAQRMKKFSQAGRLNEDSMLAIMSEEKKPEKFSLTFDGDNLHIVVPTWRSTGDVSIKADIMEEVARMYGYENFRAAPITTSFDGAINQLDKDLERRIKEYLAIRCGMQEIFTYPWMTDQYVSAILQDTTGILSLSTPPSPDESLSLIHI